MQTTITNEMRSNLARNLAKRLTPEDVAIMTENHHRHEMWRCASHTDQDGIRIGTEYFVMFVAEDDEDELYESCDSYARATISAANSGRSCWITTQAPRWL